MIDRAHPSIHARITPTKAAAIIAETGEAIDFATLDARSNRFAHLFRALGLAVGDVIAMMAENGLDTFSVAWAGQRSGLYLTALSTRLTPPEAEFIVRDCDATVMIASPEHEAACRMIAGHIPGLTVLVLGAELDALLDRQSSDPIDDEAPGTDMLYSSGTTGRPKGVRAPLPTGAVDAPTPIVTIAAEHYGIDGNTVYLSAGPLYHAAPLRWSMAVQALGGTVVILRKFDAPAALNAIERHRVTASQWVPTHFVRMLKLPADERTAFDTSSMTLAIHAAAPCPVDVKHAMMTWWGPILHEYYAGTENFGFTVIGPDEWLRKPGSVGRALMGQIHICDDDGEPLPVGTIGDVFFETAVPLTEYHGDAAKTRESRNRHGWATYGDIGRIDADGFLFLTDRRHFTIISGGVNIYPQEIEDALILHPLVRDVAVIGVPDAEMGERVIAIVEPMRWSDAGQGLADDLITHARRHLSSVKIPRQIDFAEELPRQPTGKLFKRLIRDQYLKEPQ